MYMMVLRLLLCLIAFFQTCICLVHHLFSKREAGMMFFGLLLNQAVRIPQSYAVWPHTTSLSTCTVQCLFLHCAPSARLVVVTAVSGPEGDRHPVAVRELSDTMSPTGAQRSPSTRRAWHSPWVLTLPWVSPFGSTSPFLSVCFFTILAHLSF